MESLAVFLVKNIVCAGVLFSFYILALRGRKFHQYNRFYLLGILLVSLLLPLINFRLYSFSFNLSKETGSASAANLTADVAVPAFSSPELILLICGAISVLMMVCLLLKVVWVYRMIRKHEVQRMDGYYFIESTLKEAPFTFLDKLFWKKTISLNEDAGQKIFAHELVHIREKHTYDKLFSQLVLCFFWMNPFYWFIQRELNIVHEFLADAKSIEEDDVASFAEMLLRSHNDGSYLDPVHPFFNSSVKRRLAMITRPDAPVNNYIGRLTVLPIVGLIVALFSFSVTKVELPDKTLYAQLISPKITETVIRQDSIPVIKNDAPRKILNAKKAGLKSAHAVNSKESFQKEVEHFANDKLDGMEKRAELQKSEIKESLKPVNNKEKKPPYFSEKQESETRKFQTSNEKLSKEEMVGAAKYFTKKPVDGPGKKPIPLPAW